MDNSMLFSIFFLFFIFTTFASSTASFSNIHKCSQEQSEALLLFKHTLSSFNSSTNDDCGSYNHPIMMSWNTSTDCCSDWDGVTCDNSTGDVIALDLLCGMLQGTIHPDSSLLNLTHLTHLDLSYNNLNGTLPSWLFSSPSLQYLYLDNNMFSGNVPFDSFTSPSLKSLFLHHNQLGGQIDVQTFPQLTNLTSLGLGYNNFSGELELDSLLSTLTNLDYLDLSYSGFSVTTNNANHYVNPRFSELYLASCKLKVFPNSLRAMKQLYHLDLSSNEIHGQIPHWAGEIGGDLRYLYLQSNLIEGPFPQSICNMSNLGYLDMSNNRFGGLIPQCFGIWISLRMIDMGNNSFQGTIPNVYGDCGNLEGLILNGNQLEGEVPSSLSKCQSLKVVDLGNNHLNGTFPSWLGDLPNLKVLVLKSNNFHGHIQPSATVDSPFPSLLVLDLSHNGFEGQLPAKYFQNFNSMKNVVKSSKEPEYLSMGYGMFKKSLVKLESWDSGKLWPMLYQYHFLTSCPHCFCQVSNPSIQFMLYETLLKKLKQRRALSNSNKGVTALEANIFAWGIGKTWGCSGTYPLLVVKSRLQGLDKKHQYEGIGVWGGAGTFQVMLSYRSF
ncbi:Leucine-rich repeat-containing protein [Artemisia annua]|uniref:Leucine-rich repeat-containing protein n=1 Tax=Artemisia annua TaxID=35608 RepID=A0A2U1K9F2_ARTAN|nr:Leucine-rich repeat-containing protein [Artemisia annua]